MGLKTKITVTLLVIATALGGVYCFISAFYAPYFFRDTFRVSVYVEKNPSDDLSKDNPFFNSFLFSEERINSPAASADIPDDPEKLNKLLKEGWSIAHRFKGRILPLWIKKNGTPFVPEMYNSRIYYFKKTQKLHILMGQGSPQYWGLIIPDFDCELVFLIFPFGSRRDSLFYRTGIHREDMMKVRQKDMDENNTYTRVDIPPPETLPQTSKSILQSILRK